MTSDTRYRDGEYLACNPDWHDAHAPWKAEHVVSILREADWDGMSICDIGCGTGGVLHAMAPRLPGVQLLGYDISPQAVELAEKYGNDVEVVLGEFGADERAFDLLLALDVFEHVDDYMGFLRSLHTKAPMAVFHIPLEMSVYGLLKGTMIASRANLGHLHYFSYRTALATLEGTGWTPVSYRFTRGIFETDQISGLRRLKWAPVAGVARLSERAASVIAGGFGLLVLADGRAASRSD